MVVIGRENTSSVKDNIPLIKPDGCHFVGEQLAVLPSLAISHPYLAKRVAHVSFSEGWISQLLPSTDVIEVG